MNKMTLIHRDMLSCEPILRRMPNGELLCICQCGDVTEPAPGNRVYVFHSLDEGENWSAPVSIYPEDGCAVYATEAVVIGNRMIAYLTIHNGCFLNWVGERMESTDNGYTWKAIGPLPGFETFAFPRGTIRLSNGKLMMACQSYPISPEENERLLKANAKVWDADIDHMENHVLISSDEGMSWDIHRAPFITIKGETGRRWIWSEPTLAELSDGRIVMLLRMDGAGCLYRCESKDGGVSFSAPVPIDIPNPSNKPKLISMNDGRIALVHTPNRRQGFKWRFPLSVWVSDDDLKTFSDKRIVTDFPGAFSYADGVSEGNHIRFTIEYNRHDILYVDVDLSDV